LTLEIWNSFDGWTLDFEFSTFWRPFSESRSTVKVAARFAVRWTLPAAFVTIPKIYEFGTN
jgi:hypothetical protein